MRNIVKTNKFTKDIKKLSINVQKDAFKKAHKLSFNIFENDLKIKKLVGYSGNYRVVVLKDYRMIFSYDTEKIYLLRILHRKDIYRKLS
ncbi:type II toxin-antitoxin system RelE/ParE family toxin [Candidatus Kapabacteria bacterium]|nr:type II toxin-antitoxin system RelE/ParE family toxin [Candidatus Kapabacteria bacterium]